MMSLIERSEYDDDVSMLMMFLIEISEYDDDVSNRKKKECDDDYDRQIRI